MFFTKENIVALSIFIVTIVSFLFWGLDFITGNTLLFVIASGFGIFMAFNIGGNDVANSFGTSVGAKTLTVKQALVIAAIFEISGAMLAGGEVTKTIRKGIVNFGSIDLDPMLFVFIMMSALLSAGTWLLFASKKGLPVSTTHSIVGGIVGSSLALGSVIANPDISSMDMINWPKIGTIAVSWVLSPLLGGILSYMIYWYLKKFILDFNKNHHSFKALKKHVPIVSAFAVTIISGMLLFKGLKKLHFDLSTFDISLIIALAGVLGYVLAFVLVKSFVKGDVHKETVRIFSVLQVFTASSFAFSHGANDIANAVGPFAAVIDVLSTGEINAQAPVPTIVMFTFGVSLIVGLWFIGKEVIATVGTRLAEIFPVTGFAAELGATAVILAATKLGIPVSSTHILIGAVLGIGVLNRDANWSMMKPIAMAWVITLPAAALMSAIIFMMLKIAFI